MTREEILGCIGQIGIVPGVRVPEKDLALFAAETLYEAGIPIVEITMTVPDAVDVIAQIAKAYPDCVVGGGTVLDAETSQRCIAQMEPI